MGDAILRNATISSVEIEIQHGVYTLNIRLDYGSGGQGFGGYCLAKENDPSPLMAAWVTGLMKTFEVERLSDLKGKPCRAMTTHSSVEYIGHYLKDKWFDPVIVNTLIKSSGDDLKW